MAPAQAGINQAADRQPTKFDAATEAWFDRTLAAAPRLTDRQRTALAELLRPVQYGGGR